MLRSLLCAFVAATMLLVPLSAQQSRASFSGTVTDTSGAAIPAAKVSIIAVSTNTVHAVETNSEGYYSSDGSA